MSKGCFLDNCKIPLHGDLEKVSTEEEEMVDLNEIRNSQELTSTLENSVENSIENSTEDSIEEQRLVNSVEISTYEESSKRPLGK